MSKPRRWQSSRWRGSAFPPHPLRLHCRKPVTPGGGSARRPAWVGMLRSLLDRLTTRGSFVSRRFRGLSRQAVCVMAGRHTGASGGQLADHGRLGTGPIVAPASSRVLLACLCDGVTGVFKLQGKKGRDLERRWCDGVTEICAVRWVPVPGSLAPASKIGHNFGHNAQSRFWPNQRNRLILSGAPKRIRTSNLLIRSEVLIFNALRHFSIFPRVLRVAASA
jgi:hypothetical protein